MLTRHRSVVPSVLWFAALLAPLGAQAPAPPAGWSETRQQSAERWARGLETDLRAGELANAQAAFDVDAFVDGVMADMDTASAAMRRAFRQGLRQGADGSFEVVVRNWSQSAPKFKRVLLLGGVPHARFRFFGDDGISIVDLRLVENGDAWRVSDVQNRVLGIGMVDQMRQLAVLMLEGLDTGLLGRLFGGAKVSLEDGKLLKEMVRAQQGGDPQAALAAYAKLSEPLRDSAAAMSIQVTCLAMTDDDEAYIAALERAADKHPAPMFRMSLVDAHFLRERWDEGIACIDECLRSIERDACLLGLRATLEQQAGRTDTARKTLAEALQLEADCEFVWTAGLDVWLAAKDWSAVRDAIVALEKTGEYDFRGSLEGDVWAGFRAAPESEPWR